MSVTCYNPLPQDIFEASEALFGTTEYVLDKLVFRYYIFKYCDYKGYSDYNNYKNNTDDFYNFIREYLQLNVEFDTEVIDKINEYALAIPQIVSEIPKNLVNDTLDALNSIIKDSDFKFQAIKLLNGNYKILLPSQVYSKEMVGIKKEALLRGDFKLAPNGKPTNLTDERQWLHVRTKAFKNWFGDWTKITFDKEGKILTIPNDVSKVVDENGEPLVVYHGSPNIFNTFDSSFKRYDVHEFGFFFTTTEKKATTYGNNVIAAFLNIKNIGESKIEKGDTLKSLRKRENTILKDLKFDGTKFLTADKEGFNTILYAVKSSNQIKSATDNIGSYSRENNDIRYNKDLNEDLNLLLYLSTSFKKRGHESLEDTSSVIHKAINKFHGRYYLSQVNPQEAKDNLEFEREKLRLPKGIFSYNKRGNGIEVTLNSNMLLDFIEESKELNTIQKSFDNEVSKEVLDILSFLSVKTGMKYKMINKTEAAELLKTDLSKIRKVNAFVKDGTCYFIKGRKLNADIAAEEMLHPMVHAIKQTSPKLYQNLLNEARELFPKLHATILLAYKGSSLEEKNEELVTQALSRAFRVERQNNPKGRKLVEFIQHFIESILDFFLGDIGGLFSRDFVALNEIKSNTSIVDFVKIINSNILIEFGEGYKNILMFNKEGNDINAMLAFVKAVNSKKESKGFEDFNNFKTRVQNIVKPHEDFKNNHIYLIDGVPAQTSVTKFIDDTNYENPKKEISNSESNKFKSASLAIGDSIDAAVREFFENGDKINKNNKNLPKKVLDSLENQLIMLRKQLDNHFGTTKYKVISQEINIPGNITYTDKDGNTKIKSIVGTPDLIVVSEFGDYFIVDVKTVNNSTINKNTLNKYKKQVKLYKDLMYAYTKDSSLKHRGNFILQINMQYEDTQDYALNDKGLYVSKEGELLKDNFDNVDDPISIKKHKTSSIGYFLDINGDITNEIETVINAYNIKELTPQEVKEIVLTGLVSKEVIVEEKKKADKIIKLHTKEIENKSTIDDIKLTLDTLTASEISKIGKTIVKLFCYHINILSKDSLKFQKILKIDLGNLQGMPADNIIRLHYKDLSVPLLKYISKKFFNIDSLEIDSPEYNKMAYIKKNIQTIFNRNFAEFQDIEKISVKYNLSEDLEGQYSEGLLDTLEENSREPYSVDSKEVSFLESMPARLKREFSLIPYCDRDLDGNIIYVNGYPKITLKQNGLPEFYEKNEVILNILEGVHHMRSIDDMLKYLEESEEVYCKFIYNKLKDNKLLQSIFYRTFRKNKTVYYKSSFGKNSSLTMLEDLVTRKYYMDYASSYLNGLLLGIILSDNGLFSSKNGQIFADIEKAKKLLLHLNESKNKNSEVKKQIKALYLPNFKVKYNNIGDFTSALYRFYGNVISKTNKDTNEIGLNDLIEKCYDILVKTLLPYAEKHYEMTVYDNGKTYAVYTEPTFIQDLIEDIQYGRFEETPQGNPDNWQFCRKTAEGDIYVNSFYEAVKDDDKFRKVIKHYKKTTTNDTTYQELNSHDYLCSIIQDYFCTFNKVYLPNITESQAKKMRLYRMPIMSDKPTLEAIMFPVVAGIRSSRPKSNYDLDEMKTGVARKTFEYFLLELQRMRHLINVYNESDSGIVLYNLKSNIDNNLKEKILKGLKKQKYQFKLSDFVDTKNGTWKPFLKGTGFGFWFLSEFNDILKSNDEHSEILKEAIIQYINTGDLGKADNTGIVEDSFREKFVSIMDSQYLIFKENYFNPANENSKYKKTVFNEGTVVLVDSDFLTDVIPGEKEELKDAYLQEFFYNDYIGTLNILNMTVVDPAFFKDTIDLQKRFAQTHSSTVKPNKDAEFRTSDGSYKKYSDGKHRFIVINDVEKPSVLKEQVRNVFKQKAEQFEELYKKDKSRETLLKALMYRKLESTVPELFKNVTTTDGQAFSTPTGAWKKRGMLGEDTANEFKFVLDEIRKGNYGALVNYSNTMSQVFKSFTASIVEDVENKGTYKPMQLKDSEAMLLAIEIFKKEGFESPLNAIYEVLEASHYNFAIDENKEPLHTDETYSDHGIDLAVFKSAVKEGSQKELSIEGKTYELVKDELEEYIKLEKFHVNNFDHWGQQQNTPLHFYNSTSDLGSQVRILPVADMPEDFSTEIEVDGKNVKMDKKQFLQHYFNLLSEDFNAGILKVIDDLGLNNDKSNKAYNLKKKVVDSIMKDSKLTLVILDAVDNHSTESTIIGDPDIASKVYSTVFSKIKKDVNKQNFLGGSVIQASDIAVDSNLHVRDSKGRTPQDKGFDLSKGKVTMDIMVTAYDERFLHKITFNAFNKKLFEIAGLKHSYKTGDIILVKDLLLLGILTEDDLKMIGYRIPTEDKYSCFCFNIVGFLPLASGEQIMVPYEAVGLAGFDFDIDKLYVIRKFIHNKLNENEIRKNKIFDCLWTALQHPSSVEKMFHPGDFTELKKLASELNPEAKNIGNIANIMSQIKLQNSNSAGKKFVGIAALNNISHAISNFAELKIKPLSNTYVISGVSTEFFNQEWFADTTNSLIDGSRISRTLGMFVGAAADNAKEAVLGALNITPTTANIAMALLRMGIPLNIVAGIMNIPAIKNISVNKSSFQFELALRELSDSDINTADIDINYQDLLVMSKGTQNSAVEAAVIKLLKEVIPIAKGYSRLNNICSLNSTKNAVGPTPYEVCKKQMQIAKFEEEYNISELEEGIFTQSLTELYDKVPFLAPLKECYTSLVPEICKDWSPIFNDTFELIIQSIRDSFGISVENFTSDLFKSIVNSFLVFNATKILDIDNSKLLKDFSGEVLNTKKDYKEKNIQLLDLLQVSNIKGVKDIQEVILRISTLNRSDIENISSEWEDIINNNDNTLTDFLKELLVYAVVTKGFYWHPLSYKSIASYKTRIAVENYDKIFTDFTAFENNNFERFLTQLLGNLTHRKRLWTEYEGKYDLIEGDIIELKEDTTAKMLMINEEFYFRFSDFQCRKIPKLGIYGKFFEFDANNDIKESIIKEIDENSLEYENEEHPNTVIESETNESIQEIEDRIKTIVKGFLSKYKKVASSLKWKEYIESKKSAIKNVIEKLYEEKEISYTEEELDKIITNIKEENSKYCI